MTENTLKLLGKPANPMEQGILEYITPMIFTQQENVIEYKKLTLKGCVEFCMKKGKKYEIKSGSYGFAPIPPEQHFGWVREYFGINNEPKSDKVIQFSPKPEAARSPSFGLDIDFDSLL